VTTQVSNQESLQLVLSLHRLVRSLRHVAPAAGLYPTQLIVLSQLVQTGPMRVGELAGQVPCSQPTATTIVSSLETMGLVSREPDPADGRAIRVTLTSQGRETIISVAHGEAELLSERMSELSTEEMELMLRVGPLLTRLAQPR
jgi:DNA-binding MarR family transcriptional regulator